MSHDLLQPASIFASRYQVVRLVARGGMGAVYEVIHLETQRRRALKVILADILDSDEMRRRFQQEAQIAARIESEFVVDVFDAGVDAASKMPFLVMELLRGEDLGARLKRVGLLPPVETIQVLYQAALALDRMRAANVVHRDLKPENMFLVEREDGPPRLKILDLGIAKVIADGNTRSHATRSVGTPLYMAPEQLQASSQVTPATDIYALGMIAYTLLVGRPYFVEEAYACGHVLAFALAVRDGPREAPELRAARGGVTLPTSFGAWFARATALEPDRRFFTAVSAILELASVLGVAAPSTASVVAPGPILAEATSPGSAVSLGSSRPVGTTANVVTITADASALRRGASIALAMTLALGGGVGVGVLAFANRAPTPDVASAGRPSPTAAAPSAPEVVTRAPVDTAEERVWRDAGEHGTDAGAPAAAPTAKRGPIAPPRPRAPASIYSRD